MKEIFIIADNVVSPLGWTTAENFAALLDGRSGIRYVETSGFSPTPVHISALNESALEEKTVQAGFRSTVWTKFEKLALLSISEALSQTTTQLTDPGTVFILSSTKGNISLLDGSNTSSPDLLLSRTAAKIAGAFGYQGIPVVLAHACISGVAAILAGKRLLEAGRYRHAVITGADVLSKFVVSGFQSFQALSDGPCRPFDKHRKGLNLGEACGTVILSADREKAIHKQPVRVKGGAISNDANHISGPSRTGEELSQAIVKALAQAACTVDFISAHGTATPYNDEMEAKAFYLSGLKDVPLNSLKGYFGHTLGAAGLIESVLSVESLREHTLIPCKGYEEHGVSPPVLVNNRVVRKSFQACLKTASGFGGCNAAIVFGKD